MSDQTAPGDDASVRSGGDTHPKRRSKKTVKGLKIGARLLVIAAVLIMAMVIFVGLVMVRPKSKPNTDPPTPVLVRAVHAEARPIDRVWEGYGTAGSMRRAVVAAEVSGRVIERPRTVEAGGDIDAGGLIVAIDATDYQSALARAEQGVLALRAQLDGLAVESERISSQLALVDDEIAAAERDLERTRRAVDQGAGSQGEIDAKLSVLRRSERERQVLQQTRELLPSRRTALEGELGAREADLTQAKKNVERARVVSPIPGEIESVSPRVGDWVMAGSPVATIVDVSRLEIPLRLPASASSWVAQGQPVDLWQGEPIGEPAHEGRVTRLGPAADAATRTITVYVEVEQDPDSDDRLLPGVFVHGRVRSPDPTPRVAVPRRAIRSGRVLTLTQGEDGLYVVGAVPVRTAYALDGRLESDPTETEWAVLEAGADIPSDALIATTSIELLRPGVRVRVDGEGESGSESESEPEAVAP